MEYLYTKAILQNWPQWLFNCINALPAAKYLAFKRPDHQRPIRQALTQFPARYSTTI
jgi:hypothetical protein